MTEQKQKDKAKEKRLREEFISRLIGLLTDSFGLIAALAWNQVIQELVKNYIQPFFGKDSGLISLVIYALIVTIVAVTVTYYLSRFKGED